MIIKEDCIYLETKEAIKTLSDNLYIHTFRSSGGLLVSADWERNELIKAINKSKTIRIGGPQSRSMKHGLVLFDGDDLFIEADTSKYEEDSLRLDKL